MGRSVTKIRLPYIQEYKDRTGKVRRYLRRPGYKRLPLPGTPGSRQFMAAYEAGLAVREAPRHKHDDGTIGALVVGFYRSSLFTRLKPSSQRLYRSVLDKFSQEDGHRLVRDMPRRVARRIIEEIGETTPSMANLTTSIMRCLFAYAVDLELRPDNPFARIKPYNTGTHHTWTDVEIAAYEAAWPIGTRERLAFDLLLYTAQRVGDVARMRRSDLRNGEIHITQEKTGTEITIPVHENLLRSLKATPAKGLMLIGSPHGRPMTGKGLSAMVSRAVRAVGLSEKCVPHGLRKAALTRLADHNATTKEIQAVGGHRSLREVERYTEKADQRRLARAAIARLPIEQNSTEKCLTTPQLDDP
jgi:enterobacteria phage integrase